MRQAGDTIGGRRTSRWRTGSRLPIPSPDGFKLEITKIQVDANILEVKLQNLIPLEEGNLQKREHSNFLTPKAISPFGIKFIRQLALQNFIRSLRNLTK